MDPLPGSGLDGGFSRPNIAIDPPAIGNPGLNFPSGGIGPISVDPLIDTGLNVDTPIRTDGLGAGGVTDNGLIGGGAGGLGAGVGGPGLVFDPNFDRGFDNSFDNSFGGFEINGNGFMDPRVGDFSSFDARLNAIAQGQGGVIAPGGAIGQGISGILYIKKLPVFIVSY